MDASSGPWPFSEACPGVAATRSAQQIHPDTRERGGEFTRSAQHQAAVGALHAIGLQRRAARGAGGLLAFVQGRCLLGEHLRGNPAVELPGRGSVCVLYVETEELGVPEGAGALVLRSIVRGGGLHPMRDSILLEAAGEGTNPREWRDAYAAEFGCGRQLFGLGLGLGLEIVELDELDAAIGAARGPPHVLHATGGTDLVAGSCCHAASLPLGGRFWGALRRGSSDTDDGSREQGDSMSKKIDWYYHRKG